VHEYERFWNTQLDEFEQHFSKKRATKENKR
jgi:hypothetical protein